MSIRNKTKGVKMKKVALAVAVILGFVVVQPVQASNQKALVIIDSYFDSKVSAPNIRCIVVDTNQPCTDVITNPSLLKTNAVQKSFSHGNMMVEVSKRQANLPSIILLRASAAPSQGKINATVHDVRDNNLLQALTWVNNNSSLVGAVSTSIFYDYNDYKRVPNPTCQQRGGKLDSSVSALIATLKSKNIPVFAATGNAPKTRVDYPACIADTVSVTSPGNVTDASTDVSGSLDNNAGVFNFNSPVLGPIPQTTSSVTVAVATQYLSTGAFPAKSVLVKP
jgi:hypothetical protein